MIIIKLLVTRSNEREGKDRLDESRSISLNLSFIVAIFP